MKSIRAWPVQYLRKFDMSNDSHLFRTAAQLDTDGFYPVQGGNHWKRGDTLYLPLYEGKMVQAFDHRAASVAINPENLHRPGQPEATIDIQHADPDWLPTFRYFLNMTEMPNELLGNYMLTYKRISAPTNVRTMIAAFGPQAAYEVNANNILFNEEADSVSYCSLLSNLNCIPFDYVVRQKMQGTTLNWYIVEQLPVIAPSDYDRKFGHTTARNLVRDHVLRLTYTAHDMAPFARDLGYDGPPFIWNDEQRRHLRARLDALYFHLYGLSREDAAYILDTFPIVRRHDKAAFGHYRTKAMVLAYYNALAAGDSDVQVAA